MTQTDIPAQEPLLDTKDPLANVYNQRGDKEKNRDGNDLQTCGKEEMGVVRQPPDNGSQLASKNCTHMVTRRQEEEGSTVGDMAQNCGKGALGEGLKNLGSGSIVCGRRDSLEAESPIRH